MLIYREDNVNMAHAPIENGTKYYVQTRTTELINNGEEVDYQTIIDNIYFKPHFHLIVKILFLPLFYICRSLPILVRNSLSESQALMNSTCPHQ